MADVKISELNQLRYVEFEDEIIVNDVSAQTTKKTTKDYFLEGITRLVTDSAGDAVVAGGLHVDNEILLGGDLFTTGDIKFGTLTDYGTGLQVFRLVGESDGLHNYLLDSVLATGAAIRDYVALTGELINVDSVGASGSSIFYPVFTSSVAGHDSAFNDSALAFNHATSTLAVPSISLSGNLITTGGAEVQGDLIPDQDSVRSLGSPSKKWKDLYLSGSTIFLGNKTIKDKSDAVEFSTSVRTLGTVEAGVFIGDGSQLEGVQTQIDSASFRSRAIKLIPSSQVIRYDSAGITENDTLSFTTAVENFVGAVTYEFLVDGVTKQGPAVGSSFTLADGDEPAFDQSKVVEVKAYEDGTEKAVDRVSVFGIKDGTDGVNAVFGFLTNEVHTEPADSTGELLGDLTDAGGTFKVYVGTTDVTTSPSVTYSVAEETGIDASIDANGNYTLASFTQDKANATLRAVVASSLIPGSNQDVTLNKRYSIAKAKSISGGLRTGLAARAIKLVPSSQVIRYDRDGVTESDTITFTTVVENFEGTVTYRFLVAGVEKQAQGATSTFTLPDGDEPASDTAVIVKVEAYENGVLKAQDNVTIYGVRDGQDGVNAVTAFLTNEVHTEPADSAGVVLGSLDDAGGTFKVFVGTTDVTGDASLTYSKPAESGLTASIDSAGVYTISGISQDKGVADFRVVVGNSLIPGADSDVSIDKRYSVSKSKVISAGAALGLSSRSVKLVPSSQVIRYDVDGSETDSITFTTITENFSGTKTYQFLVDDVEKQAASATSTFSLADGDEPAADGKKVVQVRVLEDGVEKARDYVTIYGVKNGSDATTGFLTNESHVEPANNAGALLGDLTDAGGTFKVFVGTTDVTGDASVTYSVVSETGCDLSIGTDGVYTVSTVSSSKGTATLRAVIGSSLIPGSSNDVTIEKTYTVSKSFTGAAGAPGTPGANGTDGTDGTDGENGVPGITAYLTNEAVAVQASSAGTLAGSALDDAGGTFKVFVGTTDVTTNANVTFTVPAESGVDITLNNSTGVYTVNSMSSDTGTATLRAIIDASIIPGSAVDVTIERQYTIVKARSGPAGSPGTNGTDGTDGTNGTNGTDGADGARGPGRWHIQVSTLPTTAGAAASRWDDGTFTGTSPGTEVAGDQAWFFTGTVASPTGQKVWIYNGSSWEEQTEVVDGNLLVAGTVTADALNISDVTTNVGKTEMTSNTIKIYDWNGSSYVLRVKIGDLS
jgi:hypothetical protein